MAYRDDPYLKRMVWIAGESHCLTTVEQEEGILTFTVVYIFYCFFLLLLLVEESVATTTVCKPSRLLTHIYIVPKNQFWVFSASFG